MKLSELAVKRPVAVTILAMILLIVGFFTLGRMAVELYPDMEFPVAAVFTTYPGAGPEEVETQITQIMEGQLSTLSNVREIQSTSSPGSSVIIIRYNWGTDMDNASIDIRERLGLVEAFLPSDAESPFVFKLDPNMMPIMQIGLSGGEDLEQLQTLAEDIIQPRLERLPGVASITLTGGLTREIRVEVDPVRLENYGLRLEQVNQVLRAENFNMAGGRVMHGEREYYVRNLQQFESIEEIKEVAILTAQGNVVLLRDIARIGDGHKDVSQMTRVNGEPAVGVHVMKQTDANTVLTCDAVKNELEKIRREIGANLEVGVVFDQSEFINQSVNSTIRVMGQGALLAMLILFLFLRNARSTLIIFTAIPLSIITTFIVMYFSGYTLNMITLGGLALGVGRMVDDAIVVFENIYRHRSEGKGMLEAAVIGVSEVGTAVIATTLTIIAVFVPIVFVEGLASILFQPMAVTIAFAMICSTFVALTVIPLLASRLLTPKSMERTQMRQGRISGLTHRFGEAFGRLGSRYQGILRWALGHRKIVVFSVLGLLLASLALIPLVGAEFLPRMDSGEISVRVETDKGSVLAASDQVSGQVEEKIKEIPEVDLVFTSVGSASFMDFGGGDQRDQSLIYIKLVSLSDRNRTVDAVAEELRRKVRDIGGARITVQVMDSAGMPGAEGGPINVQVRGDDLDMLRDLSTQITDIVRQVPGTREVSSSLADGSPELQIKVDRYRASAFGLTPMQISGEISHAMQGTVVTRYRVEGEEIDVRVRYLLQDQKDLQYLSNLPIQTPSGTPVRLSQVATFQLEQGPVQIERVDQVRQAVISGYLLNRDLGSVMDDIKLKVDAMAIPAGYSVIYGGEQQDMAESFADLGLALILAIILVYAVMAIQYESFFNPFVIMFAVPTAFIGAILALLITGRSLNVASFIGLIMMVGIVVSNAIIFVDYLQRMRNAGLERFEAVLETGRVRLRPILMTTFSTVLAMSPLAIGMGEGSELRSPLGIVVIGGLLVSAFITLVLVPVIYTILDDWRLKLVQRRAARRGEPAEQQAEG